ncbi:site-specific DNA-methyltransferase [Polaribacter sp. R2A056_3_33]|uniref:site-specific DNA-methyltransferase n=1 Tax=Polaribacter sp. R2A056_3_33 TaxID=2745563 RepID=UPI001C4E86FF|nr:site-specific DNA-methyltransferase [Polaribacter sp. R2A056_3_33]QXP69366.1 site-specific DNA-methyltransferase [Polaribacter sp. R2A056_3_33]
MPQEFKPQYTFTDDRLNELKQLFPEAWEDGVFNVDTLKTLIGDFSTDNSVKEHFGLNWVGKQDARKIAAKSPTGTLKPCLGEGVNEDTTENIFIEGENLEVLKILRKSYMGKIKMIYIDPPYNTGDDFIYKDSFGDSTEDYLRRTGQQSDEGVLVSNPKSSGKYHANWLTDMYPRLRVSKDLLTNDGFVFVSIADEEIHNLKQLMNEVYGEENFIAQFIHKNNSNKNQANLVSVSCEYFLCYAKDKLNLKDVLWRIEKKGTNDIHKTFLKLKEQNFSLDDIHSEIKEMYRRPKYAHLSRWNKIDEKGIFKDADLSREGGPKDYTIINPNTGAECTIPSRGWGKSLEELKRLQDEDLIYYGSDDTPPGNKDYITGDNYSVPDSFWYIDNSIDTRWQKEQFGNLVFDNPKPLEMIKNIISMVTNDGDIVLDFYAGSGTTGHSVIDLYNEKKIKFIITQIAEKIKPKGKTAKYALSLGYEVISEITKDRIKKAIKTIDKTQGFKVYKQDNSTIYKWQDFKTDQDRALPDLFSKMELAYKNPLQDGVTTQGFITEVILQEGFPLTAKQEEVASGIFKITHAWVPYTLYTTMLYSFKNTDFSKLQLQDTDHFVCLDKAFEGNDALKQTLDNQCKLFTI